MNLRTLKKLSKRALPLLIDMRDGFLIENFYQAEKGESYHGLDLRGRRWPDGSTGVVSCHPLKGTWMHGFACTFSDDFEESTAWELLCDVVRWAHVDDWAGDEDGLPLFPLKPGIVLGSPADTLRLARKMVAERKAVSA